VEAHLNLMDLADEIKRHAIDVGQTDMDKQGVIWCNCGQRFWSQDSWARHVAENVALQLENH
jgi:hypothetical protein